ncbi:DUF1565 domain-containing protein [Gloeobacter kilaueensis]|uniref:Alpha-ketoglutarate decarboxylase n=1 Tax=Gloeobacter kilaueensis (strain ATCC BAA-2537 / CCAP 1431/1 / ULC 316 / JS1) TaxID=1183438 RepID=U5QM00_GLOK1|nr:DUF1565 domain-containing protein [Gloeobacter kilaueensis]AGY58710.1 alpha-ketoglutarate decarboxylase [Gloeobacter kilaueensis JS1]
MKFSAKMVRSLTGWTLALSLLGPGASITRMVQAEPESSQELSAVHVDPINGNDSAGDGTKQNPFKTISRAAKAVPARGVLQLAEGEYSEASGEQFPLRLDGLELVGNESTKGEGIKIVGGGKHTSPTFASQDVTIVIGKGVTIRGVTISNPNNRGYGLWIESVSPVISDNSFIGSAHDGIFISGTSSAKINHNTFSQNIADGLTAADLSTPTIENNVFENTGFAINVTGKSRPRILGNIVRNNMDGVVIEGRAEPVLRNNTIANNKRSGVVVILLANADLGNESEAGNNTFADNGKADVNNVTKPAIPIVALGNKWLKPLLAGQVTAEAEIVALAAQNLPTQTDSFWVLVNESKPSRLSSIKGLALKPKSQSYQGKSYLQVGTFTTQDNADRLVQQLNEKGFKAIIVPAARPASKNVTTSAANKPVAPKAEPVAAIAATGAAKPVAKTAGPDTKVVAPPTTTRASEPVAKAAPKPEAPVPAKAPKAAEPAKSVLQSATSEPLAATTAKSATAYRVLVTGSSDADLPRLKELVSKVLPQTHDGKPAYQVGVFASEDNANHLVQLLSDKGFRAILVPSSLPGGAT